MLERLIDHIRSRDGIRFKTMREVAEEFKRSASAGPSRSHLIARPHLTAHSRQTARKSNRPSAAYLMDDDLPRRDGTRRDGTWKSAAVLSHRDGLTGRACLTALGRQLRLKMGICRVGFFPGASAAISVRRPRTPGPFHLSRSASGRISRCRDRVRERQRADRAPVRIISGGAIFRPPPDEARRPD